MYSILYTNQQHVVVISPVSLDTTIITLKESSNGLPVTCSFPYTPSDRPLQSSHVSTFYKALTPVASHPLIVRSHPLIVSLEAPRPFYKALTPVASHPLIALDGPLLALFTKLSLRLRVTLRLPSLTPYIPSRPLLLSSA